MLAMLTGGTGFVGRHLARHLETDGTRTVSLTSNPSEQNEDVQGFRLLDIRDDAALDALVEDLRPQQIYHLAAITSISAASSDERAAFDVNVWGTRNVLAAAARMESPVRVLNVSTSQVYGDSPSCPIREEALVRPQNTYAITKAMAELFIPRYSRRCEIVNVRAFNHSGPGQSTSFVLSYFAHEIAAIELGQHEPVLRTGNLNVKRDFSDVRDVVRAYALLMEKGRPGETYNVCSGHPYLVSDAMDYLLSLSGVRIRIEQDETKARKGEASAIYGSYDKIAHDTGWKPAITFEQMLTDILQYWRQTLTASAVPSASRK